VEFVGIFKKCHFVQKVVTLSVTLSNDAILCIRRSYMMYIRIESNWSASRPKTRSPFPVTMELTAVGIATASSIAIPITNA